MAWASLGISFLFRPLGAIIAGHLGDRIGRKKMLVLTLILMGAATSLIGLLPNYAMIGIGAPILLTLLRILQGFSAGGEWGGAALLSVEHAPISKRGIFGAYPQIGVPVGMILATGVIWVLTTLLTPEQFASFGWRIPFLFSVVLVSSAITSAARSRSPRSSPSSPSARPNPRLRWAPCSRRTRRKSSSPRSSSSATTPWAT
jgi:MFS family permease